jgi:lipid-binding SYLF domain-containing protein
MQHLKLVLGLFIVFIMFSGFWGFGEEKKKSRILQNQERFIKRFERIKVNRETLELLYKHVPEAKSELLKSYGYATFTNIGATVVFVSYENGQGMAHNNRSGRNYYMNMHSGGLGIGMGGQEFRTVFLFENKKVFDEFVNSGWEANAKADAAAKYDGEGGSVDAAITVKEGVKLYKFSKDGLLLQATVMGTKYYLDEDLNKY